VQAALDNPKQTTQWQALFNVNTSGLNAAELCKNYPHLVVDTSLFEPKFQADVLNNLHDLDEKTSGFLIHSDNFQALNLLQERYKEQVKCIYIDPPYNTGNDGFIYKDGYQKSSWATLIHNRLSVAKNLLNQSGVIFQSIDDNEQARLKLLSDGIFGEQNFVSELTIIVKPEGRRYGHFAKTHDFAYVYSKNSNYLTLNEILAEGAEHKYFDGQGGFSLKGLRNRNVQAFNSTNRPNLRYPFFVDEASADSNGFMKVSTIPKNDFVKVEASVINGLESVWRWGKEKSERAYFYQKEWQTNLRQ